METKNVNQLLNKKANEVFELLNEKERKVYEFVYEITKGLTDKEKLFLKDVFKDGSSRAYYKRFLCEDGKQRSSWASEIETYPAYKHFDIPQISKICSSVYQKLSSKNGNTFIVRGRKSKAVAFLMKAEYSAAFRTWAWDYEVVFH